MNAALILAGGRGERMLGLPVPKQFHPVRGRPLIAYALRRFQDCAAIGGFLVVAEEAWRALIGEWLAREGVAKFLGFADPGETRQESVFAGLLAMECLMKEDDVVLVHDAVRPAVTEALILACIEEARRRDGATPALRVRETIYQSGDGRRVSALLDRDGLYIGQTPEGYRFGKYLAAHRSVTRAELAGMRGSSELAFRFGMDVGLFPGDERNFKITTIEDLERFERLAKKGEGYGAQ
ncbi:MAG: 2-C-methyl-D-erythritol 4-phosphate cytidylyltransferase [Clostridiales Family XIII bacterium]|jgi:2-C-methyl-D-erythritol 4-phosphate cytidylyltransferase|nr:2-C-methyl-D-erythritol 4-phosphate cytidylyltransferase [Clostridiales Family XIII bacterium]